MKKPNSKFLILSMCVLTFLLGCGSSNDTAALLNGNNTNNVINPVTPATCAQQGGLLLANDVCKFVFNYVLMGAGSGVYWLSGGYIPLIKPHTSDEINGIVTPPSPIQRQSSVPLQQIDAKDLVTFSGDPKWGDANASADGCDDKHAIKVVVDDGELAYPLTKGAYTEIQNSGTLRAGFDKSAQQNWSNNCVEANNNTPVVVTILHCVKDGSTIVCP